MSGWQTTRLKDVCERVTVGFVGSMAHEYRDDGIPFLRSQNITPFRLSFENLKFIDDKFHQKIGKSALRPGDVGIVRTGYPGTACVIPRELPVANCSDLVIVRPGKQLNPYFLCAIFNSAFGRDLVGGNLVGVAQQHFNVTVAKELKLSLPPRRIQDMIAAILTAYDDLIESNRRRIALLEGMAEEFYREWFVRLRFPGHEQAKFEKGLPVDWRELASSDVFDVLSGGTPKTDVAAYWDGDIPFFTPKDATENFYVLKTEKNITAKGLNTCNSKLYAKDTIFITARGTVGKLALASRDMAMNQSCYALVPKDGGPVYFHYLAIQNAITYLKGISKSGVFDNVVVDTFRTVPIVMPTNELIKKCNQILAPLFIRAVTLLRANEALVIQRDLLLPRLISGKLPVDGLDIRFPPSMQID